MMYKRIFSSNLVFSLIMLLIIDLLFGLLTLSKSYEAFNSYMSSIVPLFLFCAGLMLLACNDDNIISALAAFLFSFMMISGFSFQCIIAYEDSQKYLIITLVASIIAAVILILFKYVFKAKVLINKTNYKRTIYALFIITFLIYVILIIFGSTINGARLWLSIGGLSLQLSEFTKLIFFIALGLIFNSGSDSKKKLLLSTLLLIMNAFFLAILNEFGTIVLLSLCYVILSFVFLKTRYSVIMLAVSIALVVLFIVIIFGLYWILDFNNITDGFIASKVIKLYDRLMLSDSLQQTYAYQAFINGSIVGCNQVYTIDLFASDSDFALANLCQQTGIVVTLAVIISLMAIVYLVYLAGQNDENNNSLEYKFSYIFTTAIAVQGLISFGSNISVLPCFGIGFPLISKGGSQTIILYTMIAFIIYGIKTKRNAPIYYKALLMKERF